MPLLSISMSEVPAADAGLAAGFGNVTMQMGAAIGLAALGAISTAHAQTLMAEGWTVPAALTGGYQLAFLLAALCVLAGLVVVIMVIRPSGGGTPTRERFEFDRTEAEAA
jgi:hypothetical protein